MPDVMELPGLECMVCVQFALSKRFLDLSAALHLGGIIYSD